MKLDDALLALHTAYLAREDAHAAWNKASVAMHTDLNPWRAVRARREHKRASDARRAANQALATALVETAALAKLPKIDDPSRYLGRLLPLALEAHQRRLAQQTLQALAPQGVTRSLAETLSRRRTLALAAQGC